MAKGALHSENMTGGGAVPDGEYTITVRAGEFDYGGRGPTVPAGIVTYKSDDGTEQEQGYSAGDKAELAGDGKTFKTIGKSSNFSLWLASMFKAGFPEEKAESDVTCFNGTKVSTVAAAQQKRPGIKDQQEGRTIVLIEKVLALPGAKGVRPTAGIAAAKSTTTKASAPSSAATSASGASGDEAVIGHVKAALKAAGGMMEPAKVANAVFMAVLKTKIMEPPAAQALKKTLTPDWLIANAEAGGWVADAEIVVLGDE